MKENIFCQNPKFEKNLLLFDSCWSMSQNICPLVQKEVLLLNFPYYHSLANRCLVGDPSGKSYGDVAFLEHHNLDANILGETFDTRGGKQQVDADI